MGDDITKDKPRPTKAEFTIAEAVDWINQGDKIQIYGTTLDKTNTNDIDGNYIVDGVSGTTVTVKGYSNIPEGGLDFTDLDVVLNIAPGVSLNAIPIAAISDIKANGKFQFVGNLTDKFTLGCKFVVKGATTEGNNTTYIVSTNEGADPISYDEDTRLTTIIATKDDEEGGDPATGDADKGTAYFSGLGKPESFDFQSSDQLMLITGIDAGSYNNDIQLDIKTSVDFPDDFVYAYGASVGGKRCTFDTMQLTVTNGNTGEELESFLFSRDPQAKTIDGISLYVDNVVSGSAYIRVIDNNSENNSTPATVAEPDENGYYALPASTFTEPVNLSGGDNGGTVNAAVLEAALEPFRDKLQTLSILGNGCSVQAETKEFQQALMGVADDRKDLVVFLNNPADTENKTLNSQKAQAIVDYKKHDLANTSFYGCMYAPHVNTSDTFNQRQVKIGAEAVAIAGWLDVIGNLNYPYAYAGPKNGLVQGVTCDWKIGDMSGEAQLLNDASVNYVAYDGKVGRYYMQCQNTLQVANSSMRNIGTVLNVLDIKEHFVTLLKEYLQLPITDDLRREIVDVSNDYLSPMLGVRFSNYAFQDVTKPIDLADNTLRFLLTIAPTPYAQKIYLTMNIVNATFDFGILQSM